MKGLMKVFSGGLAMWRMIGLLREYVGESVDSCLVGKLQKRWIDNIKDCLRKRGLYVRQVKRMVQDRSQWQGFVRGMN